MGSTIIGDFVGDEVGFGVTGAGLGIMGGCVTGTLVTGINGASVVDIGDVVGEGGFAAFGADVVWAIAIDDKLLAAINCNIIVAATMFCIIRNL